MATDIIAFASNAANANLLEVQYTTSVTPAPTSLRFDLTVSADAAPDAADVLVASYTETNGTKLGVGTFAAGINANFAVPVDKTYLIASVFSDTGALLDSQVLANSFYASLSGNAYLFGSDVVNDLSLGLDASSGKFTFKVGSGAVQQINAAAPISSFSAHLYGGNDIFESKLDSIQASAINQRVYAGLGADQVRLYNTNAYVDGGIDSDTNTVTVYGTEQSDVIEYVATGVKLGGAGKSNTFGNGVLHT